MHRPAVIAAVLPLLAALLLAGAGEAQQTRYKSWRGGEPEQTQADERLGTMLRELRELVDQASRDRAADPRFLEDLRTLARRYDDGQRRRRDRYEPDHGADARLHDDFSDGDYTRNPAWQVGQGRFWVDRNGLATRVGGAPASGGGSGGEGDLAAVLLGTVLGGGASGDGRDGDSGPASIYLPHHVPNAFRLEADLGVLAPGAVQIAVYQGSSRTVGYRLAYKQGRGLVLQRRFANSADVIASADIGNRLADGRLHRFVWLRDHNGEMSVSVDGTRVMTLRDTGFRDPFDGIMLINDGGEYRLKQIAVAAFE